MTSRVARDRRAMLGVAAVLALGLIALLAPLLAPNDPFTQLDLVGGRLLPPSATHPMGTDRLSRDVLSRVLFGARISLGVASLSVALSVGIGTALGLTTGWFGGVWDTLTMRVVDALLAIPRIFLLVVILALWRNVGVAALILVLALTSWFDTSRLIRAEVLSLKTRDFMTAARALGIGTPRLLLRHVLPNVASPLIVSATLGIGQMVLIEAGLSFLGIGVPPPVPSWGRMIADGSSDLLVTAPWIALFPGIAIVCTVLAFSLLGDGLQRALDPHARVA